MVVWLHITRITGGPRNFFFSFGSKSHETIKEIIQFIYLGKNLFFKVTVCYCSLLQNLMLHVLRG